jgi:peroxidase
VIDQAKTALEKECQGVVSCADIIAFAARDATAFLSNGSVQFDMPSGRFDGRVSLASETLPNLPSPFDDLTALTTTFESKGLSLDDMVTLSGAHTVGISHCSSFASRLPRNASDPLAMHSTLAGSLRRKCRSGSSTVDHDFKTPEDLDSQYYRNVLDGKVLLKSDAALMSSPETEAKVRFHAYYPWVWAGRFKAAMVKMGGIEVKTSANGEIRKQCRFINAPTIERVYVLSADS